MSAHDDYLDPDLHLWPAEPPEWYMEGQQVVFEFFGCDTDTLTEQEMMVHCKKYLYKGTACGAWIEFSEDGIILGSIVEGCDFETAIYPLSYKRITSAMIQERIDAIEAEAEALWAWANDTDEDGNTQMDLGVDAPDVSFEYRKLGNGILKL